MRIVHVSTRLILGGSQENTVLSCEGQARLGHEVHLVHGPIYGPEGNLQARVDAFDAQAKREGRPGITRHEVATLVRDVSPVKDWTCRRDLRRLFERLRPDIVHTHSSKAGVLGRLAAWESRPRPAIVHTIHGPPFMPLEGSIATRLKTQAANAVYTLAERKAARACHVIVSVAEAMTRQFLERRIGRPEQFVTVRSGMELEAYLTPHAGETRGEVRTRLGLHAEDFVIGTVARLAQHKGHEDLVAGLSSELRTRPGWKMLWVGDGWWRERLVAKCRHAGLAVCSLETESLERVRGAQVVLTGLVPPERIAGLMRAMDVLVHPSAREGLPRTVPQALAAGTAVVASDADGTPEVCVDGQTGKLVRVGDAEGYRRAVVWMAEHEDERRAMAQRGQQRVVEEFSAQTMVDRLEVVYARALDLRGGA
jgi:glycosyltransferase involved in cell wall biosynthesis